jgi:hypothetical protein
MERGSIHCLLRRSCLLRAGHWHANALGEPGETEWLRKISIEQLLNALLGPLS